MPFPYQCLLHDDGSYLILQQWSLQQWVVMNGKAHVSDMWPVRTCYLSTGTVTRVGSFSRGLMQMRSGTPQILSYRRYLIKRNHIFELFYSLDK